MTGNEPHFPIGCVLAFSGESGAAVSSPRTVGGQPVQRFRKDVMRVGRYHKAADGLSFEVTPETLQHWAATFSRMKGNGVKIPVPVGHSDVGNPEKNRGWVEDLFVEDDRLVAAIDLIGDEAIKLAGISDVSLYVPPKAEDGKGNSYRQPITHIALCTEPVIPGLGEFVPIAASQGATPVNVPVLKFKGDPSMSFDLDKVKAAIGVEELTAENAEQTIIASFQGLQTKVANLEKKLEATGDDKGDDPPEVNPELLRLSRENYELRMRELVEKGVITPAVRDKFVKECFGEDNATLALSLQYQDDTLAKVLDILKENHPVKPGEKTGPQLLSLSHGGDDKGDANGEAVYNRMAKAAGIPVKGN